MINNVFPQKKMSNKTIKVITILKRLKSNKTLSA